MGVLAIALQHVNQFSGGTQGEFAEASEVYKLERVW